MSKPTIIYIAGYGRSGSTLLDVILGNHPNVLSTGELTSVAQDSVLNNNCSCGVSINACELYGDLIHNKNEIAQNMESIIRHFESRGDYLRTTQSQVSQDNFYQYRSFHEQLFNDLSDSSGCQYIVDSSKTVGSTANRVRWLKFIGFDVKVIHIYKNLGKIWQSVRKGSNHQLQDKQAHKISLFAQLGLRAKQRVPNKAGPLTFAVKSLVGWYLANKTARSYAGLVGEGNYMKLNYDKFITNPEKELNRLGYMLNLDVTGLVQIINNNDCLKVGHIIGGNRMKEASCVHMGNKQCPRVVKTHDG